MKRNLSRRQMLKGAAAAAGAAALVGPGGRLIGTAHAQTAQEPALLVIHLDGGYNALFNSADSFASNGTFGVSSGNIKQIGGTPLFVDNGTFGTLPAIALSNIA